MQKILVITNNLQQASYRLRIAALAPALLQRGFDLVVKVRPKGLLGRRRLLKSADEYDAVILQRKLVDAWDARLLKKKARRIYYDVDDAVMNHNRDVGLISRWRNTRRYEATCGVIDHVVAGNVWLAEQFQKQGCRTTVLPTVVDVGRYAVKLHQLTDRPALVWVGSKSTLPYLQEALPSLEQSAQAVPGLRLLIVADAFPASSKIPIEPIPWSPESEIRALQQADIGIAPTPLDQWTPGKCGFKIVQYMAAGLPVIASPVGANCELVWPGVSGLLPKTLADWPAVVTTLARDLRMRSRMGAEGRKLVEEKYNVNRAADTWAAILSTACA